MFVYPTVLYFSGFFEFTVLFFSHNLPFLNQLISLISGTDAGASLIPAK